MGCFGTHIAIPFLAASPQFCFPIVSLPAIRPSGLPENVETDLKARLHSFRKLRRTVATLFQLSLDPLEGGEKRESQKRANRS
jgi:hypothetical protein